MPDVVIVGGGPAGCYAAARMAKEGLTVLVLEEHHAIGEPVDCSGIIGCEAFEVLGLSREPVLDQVRAVRLISPSGFSLSYDPDSPLAYVVDRAAFDRMLAERALTAGAAIRTGCRVLDLDQARSSIEAVVEDAGGRTTIKARMAVLASGPWYKLQEKLGMGAPRAFLRTAQAEGLVEGVAGARVLFGREVAPRSFAWLLPFRRREGVWARIGVSSRSPAVPYLKKFLERLKQAGHLLGPEPSVRAWIIPIAPLSRTFADRVLAVGDAAGQTKPTTGGGLFYGLLCARFAAETAILALKRGDFSAGFLSRYEKQWKHQLGLELKVDFLFRKLFERLTDAEIDACFRAVGSNGLLSKLSRKVHFDWHKDAVLAVLRQPQLARIFLGSLLRL